MTTGFKIWLEETSHIKISLPSVQQSHAYDCGSACLRGVCEYFKVGPEKEADFIKACKTKKSKGTKPEDLIRAAHLFGLNVKSKAGMTLEEVKAALDAGRPIICPIQAHGEKTDQYNKKENGHYVVAIGYDNQYIYFEDPKLTGSRGFLPFKEFQKRWKDQDVDGNQYVQYGIIIWKPAGEETDREFIPKAKKIP